MTTLDWKICSVKVKKEGGGGGWAEHTQLVLMPFKRIKTTQPMFYKNKNNGNKNHTAYLVTFKIKLKVQTVLPNFIHNLKNNLNCDLKSWALGATNITLTYNYKLYYQC